MNDWIRTATGRKVRPLAMTVDMVDIEDIAHALSNVCRYTGHTKSFYSVAQHSVLVARQMPVDVALWGLLHDASEAYIADIARPVKHQEALSFYRILESQIMYVVAHSFGLLWPEPSPVKIVDDRMLHTEMRDLMNGSSYDEALVYPFKIIPWAPGVAKDVFLQTFEEVRHYAR